MGCVGCGIRIPPAGAFGAGSQTGPGIPPEGSLGTLLGAGAVSTDTRVGGNGAAIAATSLSEWYKSPLALLALLVLAALFARRVIE